MASKLLLYKKKLEQKRGKSFKTDKVLTVLTTPHFVKRKLLVTIYVRGKHDVGAWR